MVQPSHQSRRAVNGKNGSSLRNESWLSSLDLTPVIRKKGATNTEVIREEQFMKIHPLQDPYGKKWFLHGNTIHFAGKTGIGDVMLGLNTSYYVASRLKKK